LYKTILLAIDGSENAMRAMEKAIELQKVFKSEVIAFHAVEYHRIPTKVPRPMPFNTNYAYNMATADQELIRQKYLDAGKELLNQTQKKFKEAGVEVDARLVEFATAEEFALEAIEKFGIDLIIIGCNGDHSKLERVFLGTVAQKLVNEAKCDVLTVR
jgi:nucleotide-binding universal stress UspA family protein